MANSRTKNTILNGITSILVRCVVLITAFVTRTIFIKVLGVQYVGVSGVFTDVLLLLSFAELGIGSAITYALYKPIAEDDGRQIGKLMVVYKRIYHAIALIVLVVGLSLTPFLGYIIRGVPGIVEDIRTIYILYILQSASSYLLIYKATFLTAAQKDYLVSKIKIFASIGTAIIQCVLLLVWGDFIAYLVFTIIAGLLQNYITAKYAEKEYPILKQNSNLHLEKEEKKTLFANVRALFLYKVSGVVLQGSGSIIISVVINTVTVGVLSNYKLLTTQLRQFVMQIFNATSASIGNMSVTCTGDYQYAVFKKMLFICFWIYCVCSTGLWILLNPFITLWLGEEFLLSNYIVWVIVLDFFIEGFLSPISQFRTSNGLFVQGKYRPIIMAVLNIVLSVILTKEVGIAGIYLGIIISRALTQLWFDPWLIYKHVFKRSVFIYYRKYITYLLIMAISCLLSSSLLHLLCQDIGFYQFVVGVVLTMIIPNLMIILCFFKTEEFQYIIEFGKNMVNKKKR